MSRAILLVDHGSHRSAANEQLERVADAVRERVSDCMVAIAHMELATPSISEAIGACVASGADEIIVHPYFLAPGSHTTTDIPRLVEEAMRQHQGVSVRISEPLGLHPKLVDVILHRVDAV